mgnify:CR=1 FL=1
MNKEEFFWGVMLAAISGWLAALARELKNERRKLNWRLMMLETPGAIVCGLIGGGVSIIFGWTHPLAIAGCASVCGHIGTAILMQMITSWIKRHMGHE